MQGENKLAFQTAAARNHLRRWPVFCAVAWIWCLSFLVHGAENVQPTGQGSVFGQMFRKGPDFLPVDEAFRLFAQATDDGHIEVYFQITPEYYLYRQRFTFNVAGVAVEPVNWPTGEQHEDEYFGTVEVYRDDLTLRLPTPSTSGNAPPTITVGYQGCADAGLCYPPTERQLAITGMDGRPPAALDPPATAKTVTTATADQSPAELQSLFWFLLAGLGLTFTPCVLPMLPILSSVILGPGKRVSTPRATALTLAYVSSMAVTFALAGVLVGYFGARLNLQAHLQNPLIISIFAGLFVLLALSMFDLYEVRMPAALRRLAHARGGEGSLTGAALMGAISSLVVSPCVTAPLAGALLYIAATGDALYGGLALLTLGGGMGVPLLIAGIGGGRLIPRSGPWMLAVKQLFGVLMIGVAIWMLERFLAGPLTLAMWAGLALLCAVGARAVARSSDGALENTANVFALGSFLLAAIWLVGSLSGASSPLQPLSRLTAAGNSQVGGNFTEFHRKFRVVHDISSLQAELRRATEAGQPAFVDIYADWCISCRIMEDKVLGSAAVQQRLAGHALIRADVTVTNAKTTELLEFFGVFGPPAWIFFDAQGQEARNMRVVGEISEDHFILLLDRRK